ncbi:MAG: hypothetical protein V4717_11920 [Bacteroidota bacterium]
MRMGKFLIVTAFGLFAVVSASAQLQVSASGSYLKGVGDNDAGLWGGGLGLKGFLGENLALGARLSSYPKKTSSKTTRDGSNYTESDLITNAVATVDLLLGKKTTAIQPYIGADIGANFNNHTITYTNAGAQFIKNENKKTYFLLAPKAGVNIGIGQAFGIFGQAQYNVTFGDGRTISINDVPNPFTSEAVSKFFTFDAGIYFRLSPAK